MAPARERGLLPVNQRGAFLPIGADVVERLRAGDVAAFGEVYARCHVRLLGFLLRLTRDEALARDLAQEAWLRLAANARRLAPDSEPAAWLFTVARNLYVSRRRWALLDRERLRELASIAGSAVGARSPLEHACRDELQRAVERARAALPLPEREAVLLVCVEGFAANDAARMLELTPQALRKRLSRARAKLRAALPVDLLEPGAAP
jgi:RNA polymerase sigma-70 factor (ECF subfamily)